MMATDKVANYTMNAKQKYRDAMTNFSENRLFSTITKSLFDPMNKLKLKTFSSMTRTVKS